MVQKSIVYKICKSKTGTSGGDTVNPFNHLKRKHPKEYAESQVTQGEHECNSAARKNNTVKAITIMTFENAIFMRKLVNTGKTSIPGQ